MAYEPTWESVSTHLLPRWYDDAKLGVFLHWGLYSVPGWAPQVPDIQELLHTRGPKEMLRTNPYAEWYLNSMRVPGSPTREHHLRTYGDVPYDTFVEPFDAASSAADLAELAQVCRGAGARYVVLTTKHHDGYCLWPATTPHPRKGRYHAGRDLVGDLTREVRAAGMRMGLYYSGGYDWPYNDALLANPADVVLAVPPDPAYNEYATAHVRELIDRYRPDVLWNDIGWPAGGNLAGLFAHYYDTVPDGVVNDRWLQASGPRNAVVDAAVRAAGTAVQAAWRFLPESWTHLTFPAPTHHDVRTPEYATFDRIRTEKWESTRGVGHSFGANRNERPEDIVTTTELVRSLCDIVSKNGNLLIGIGPRPDGAVPDEQVAPLRGLGEWLATRGEAIHGTRPWRVAEGATTEGTDVRFTASTPDAEEPVLYVHLVDPPGRRSLGLRGVRAREVRDVRLLGVDEPVRWSLDDERALRVDLPERLPVSPVHVLAVRGDLVPLTG